MGRILLKTNPDGTRIYQEPDGTQTAESLDGTIWKSSDNWQSFTPGNQAAADRMAQPPVDVIGGLTRSVTSNMPAKTLPDTLATLAKYAPAAAGVGLAFGGGGAPVGDGSIPSEFGTNATDTLTSGPSSGVPSWLLPALKAAVPLATTLATRGNSGSGANGLDSTQNGLLTQLIQMSLQRQQESAPIHQAAMKLAGSLAPTGSWKDSPRFNDAVQQTTGPSPVAPTNPTIAAAYAKLLGR